MTKANCAGCEEDFYNGHNPLGVKECWNFKTAVLKPFLLIHINQAPPYKQEPQMLPACYRMKRHVKASPSALDSEGYWKS